MGGLLKTGYLLQSYSPSASSCIILMDNLLIIPHLHLLYVGEETLYMFARIRGIQESMIPSIVTYLVEALDLTAHRHKQTRRYR